MVNFRHFQTTIEMYTPYGWPPLLFIQAPHILATATVNKLDVFGMLNELDGNRLI